jgi:hypothetical protein
MMSKSPKMGGVPKPKSIYYWRRALWCRPVPVVGAEAGWSNGRATWRPVGSGEPFGARTGATSRLTHAGWQPITNDFEMVCTLQRVMAPANCWIVLSEDGHFMPKKTRRRTKKRKVPLHA